MGRVPRIQSQNSTRVTTPILFLIMANEYLIDDFSFISAADLQTRLNALDAEGWDLTACVLLPSGCHRIVMRRARTVVQKAPRHIAEQFELNPKVPDEIALASGDMSLPPTPSPGTKTVRPRKTSPGFAHAPCPDAPQKTHPTP
jgi:hypothetical protein